MQIQSERCWLMFMKAAQGRSHDLTWVVLKCPPVMNSWETTLSTPSWVTLCHVEQDCCNSHRSRVVSWLRWLADDIPRIYCRNGCPNLDLCLWVLTLLNDLSSFASIPEKIGIIQWLYKFLKLFINALYFCRHDFIIANSLRWRNQYSWFVQELGH